MGLTQVSTSGIKDNAITKAKIPDGEIDGNELSGSVISTDKLANNAVTGPKIAGGTIEAVHLKSDVITTVKIADANVTSAKLADEAVTLAKLEHGTSSNDGKFLRANNGADPSYESIPAGITINGQSDNRVLTATSTTDTLQSEPNFLHDAANCDTTITGYEALKVIDLIVSNTNPFGNAAGARITIESGSAANTGPQFQLICGSHNWSMQVPKAAGNLEFNNNGTLDFLMANDGDFHIVDGDLILSTAGHGIDFSDTSDASGGTNELLDDYEEGQWTVGVDTGSNTSSLGYYVKIGRMVHVRGEITLDNITSSNNVSVNGLPYVPLTSSPGGATFEGSLRGYGAQNVSSGRFATNCTTDSGNRVGFGTMSGQGQGWEMLKHNDFNSTNNAIRFTVTYQVA